jgi:hypothetical protein
MFDRVPLSGVVIQFNGQRKSQVFPKPHVYIDDAPHVAKDVLENTDAHVVLYDSSLNQDVEEGPRLRRAKGWRDVVDAVRFAKGTYE